MVQQESQGESGQQAQTEADDRCAPGLRGERFVRCDGRRDDLDVRGRGPLEQPEAQQVLPQCDVFVRAPGRGRRVSLQLRLDCSLDDFLGELRCNHIHFVFGDYMQELEVACWALGIRPIIPGSLEAHA